MFKNPLLFARTAVTSHKLSTAAAINKQDPDPNVSLTFESDTAQSVLPVTFGGLIESLDNIDELKDAEKDAKKGIFFITKGTNKKLTATLTDLNEDDPENQVTDYDLLGISLVMHENMLIFGIMMFNRDYAKFDLVVDLIGCTKAKSPGADEEEIKKRSEMVMALVQGADGTERIKGIDASLFASEYPSHKILVRKKMITLDASSLGMKPGEPTDLTSMLSMSVSVFASLPTYEDQEDEDEDENDNNPNPSDDPAERNKVTAVQLSEEAYNMAVEKLKTKK